MLSLISLAKSWEIPAYFGGDWNEHIGNDNGVDDTHIGQYTSREVFSIQEVGRNEERLLTNQLSEKEKRYMSCLK